MTLDKHKRNSRRTWQEQFERALELDHTRYRGETGYDLDAIERDGVGDLIESIDYIYKPSTGLLVSKVRFISKVAAGKSLQASEIASHVEDFDSEKYRRIMGLVNE